MNIFPIKILALGGTLAAGGTGIYYGYPMISGLFKSSDVKDPQKPAIQVGELQGVSGEKGSEKAPENEESKPGGGEVTQTGGQEGHPNAGETANPPSNPNSPGDQSSSENANGVTREGGSGDGSTDSNSPQSENISGSGTNSTGNRNS